MASSYGFASVPFGTLAAVALVHLATFRLPHDALVCLQ